MIAFSCDFCGKSNLVISRAGIVYCNSCKKSIPNPEFENEWRKWVEKEWKKQNQI